jgi:thiol-disulfide isomerase/thioredoxin
MKNIVKFVFIMVLVAGPAFAEDKDVPDADLSQVRFGDVVNGVDFKSADLAGKVVVVEKWGTRCGPCIAFLPELVKIHKRYEKKGLAVVGMEVQNSETEAIIEVLDDARVKYPVVKGGNTPVSSKGIPHALVFGADGKLIWAGNPHDDEFLTSIKQGLRKVDDAPPAAAENDQPASGPIIASRDWTNTDGKKIRAEVVRIDDSKVTFRMNGNREIAYDIAKLSEDDQKLIREAAEE